MIFWKKRKYCGKKRRNSMKYLVFSISIFFFLLFTIYYLPASPRGELFTLRPANALNMKGANYIIQMENLNTAAGRPTGANYKVNLTLGQTAPGLYSGTNYKVRSGFQYVNSIIKFAFAIDSQFIDLGTLTATTPVTRTNILTVSNGSANGYAVTANENHQLKVPVSGALIPDTTCDNGTCSPTTSAAWTSTLTYGFGYRCDNVSGTDCASGFTTSTFYKQFAASPSAQTVMSGTNVGRNKKVTITYKVNISSTQTAGLYGNVITYVATPTF